MLVLLALIVIAVAMVMVVWRLGALNTAIMDANTIAQTNASLAMHAERAKLHKILIEHHDLGLEKPLGKTASSALYDMLITSYEIPFMMNRRKAIDRATFQAQQRALNHLFTSVDFREHVKIALKHTIIEPTLYEWFHNEIEAYEIKNKPAIKPVPKPDDPDANPEIDSLLP